MWTQITKKNMIWLLKKKNQSISNHGGLVIQDNTGSPSMSHYKCSGHRSARLPGALSHWPSNISWFIRSHLWPPGQLGAVGAVKGALVTFYCVVIHWNWLAWPRILIFWKNSNHPETHRPSVPEQVGEGWMSSFGRLPRETAEGRNPLCPLWSPFRLPTQSTRCISAQGMEVGGVAGGGSAQEGVRGA